MHAAAGESRNEDFNFVVEAVPDSSTPRFHQRTAPGPRNFLFTENSFRGSWK